MRYPVTAAALAVLLALPAQADTYDTSPENQPVSPSTAYEFTTRGLDADGKEVYLSSCLLETESAIGRNPAKFEFKTHGLDENGEAVLLSSCSAGSETTTNSVYRPRTIEHSGISSKPAAITNLARANEGDSGYQYTAALLFFDGEFLPLNWHQGMKYLVLSAKQRHFLAEQMIIRILKDHPERFLDQGIEMPDGQIVTSENVDAIIDGLIRKAAMRGDPSALIVVADQMLENEDLAVEELVQSQDGVYVRAAPRIAAHAYYSLAALYPSNLFLRSKQDLETFHEVRDRAKDTLDTLVTKMSVEDINIAQGHSYWVFQEILRNTNEGS